MISFSHNFIFVHTPKTGGNSVQHVLKHYSNDRITTEHPWQDGYEQFGVRVPSGLPKHARLGEYQQIITPGVFEEMYKFTTVRNPWDWYVSMYFSPHAGRETWSHPLFLAFINQIRPLDGYVWRPSEFDYVMRFESLQDDFREVGEEVGIMDTTLPHVNASDRLPYQEYYNKRSRAAVEALNLNTIEWFEYEWED